MPLPTLPGLHRPARLLLPILVVAGLLRSATRRSAPSLRRLGGAALALLIAAAGLPAGPTAAATNIPPYAYIVASGPTTYDLMLWDGAKDKRLVTTSVFGTGVSDAVARLSPDQKRIAYRVTSDRNSGSSLRLFDIQARKALTITYSKSANLGIGRFAWAPDSKSLAFTWTTPALPNPDDGYGSVWMVDANGKNQRKVLSAQLNDRLVAWGPDSKGFYFERREDVPTLDDPILHLMYLPLGGQARAVLRSVPPVKKNPGLLFDSFQVWAPPVISGTIPPPVRIAALAAGNLDLLPQAVPDVPAPPAAPAPTAVPFAPPGAVPAAPAPTAAPPPLTTAKVGNRAPTDDKPALVVGTDDGAAFVPLAADNPRPDVLAWTPDGAHLFAAGGKPASALWFDLATGKRITLTDNLARMQPLAWSADKRYAVFANAGIAPATAILTLDLRSGALAASRRVGTTTTSVVGAPVKDMNVPYINQVWDTANTVNGNWACGPTSAAMVLAYYGRLTPWPLANDAVKAQSGALRPATGGAAQPVTRPGRDFAQYITAPFSYKGHDFSHVTKDPAGHKVAGLYGSIVFPDGLAHWEAIQQVLGLYDLKTTLLAPTWGAITAQLDKGYPVMLGTNLTEDGHILVARGYTTGGYLIVNDPYGNKFGSNGYGGNDGEAVTYPWKKATVKLAEAVIGTAWTPTPVVTGTATITGTVTALQRTAVPTPRR